MARWEGSDVRIELPRVSEAHVRIVAGEVGITAGNGPAAVDAEVVHGPPMVVEVDGGVLMVTHQPESWLERVGIGVGGRERCESIVTLTLPADVPVTVHSVSGDVVVAGVRGGVAVTTVSGRITASDVGGDVRLTSVSGSIEAQAVDGAVAVNTVSGTAVVTGRVPELNGHAVSGTLTFDLDEIPEVSLSTVSGDVVLRLPNDDGMHLDLTTVSGTLDSGFPFTGTSSRRRLSGEVGAGGRNVAVRTMSGDIAILGKARATASAGAIEE